MEAYPLADADTFDYTDHPACVRRYHPRWVHSVNMKYNLSQIEADCRGLHWVPLSAQISSFLETSRRLTAV